MCLQPEPAGNAHPGAGQGQGRVAMEMQPMSHWQPCKWLVCHGSFSRRSRENWELRENVFKCLQQGRARTMLGVLSVCGDRGTRSTPGAGSAASLGCLTPSPSSCWGSRAGTPLGCLGFPCLPSGQQLSLTLLLPGLWQPNSCTCCSIASCLSCAR